MFLKSFARIFQKSEATKPAEQASSGGQGSDGMLVVSEADAPTYIAHNLAHACNELERLYYSHQGRRIFKWHHYLAIYDRYLQAYKSPDAAFSPEPGSQVSRNSPLKVLEIGVQNGGSLQLWRRFFGKDAIIFGIDIDSRCREFADEGNQIRIGDQSDPTFLKQVVEEMGGIDVVIDDGSHIASHQVASFKVLFPMLAHDGIYICEDLHTSYWDGWEGGYLREGTFIEFAKALIDQLHGWYFAPEPLIENFDIKRNVLGVALYDSVAVIEKASKQRPFAVQVGNSSFQA